MPWVDRNKCTGCNICIERCPVDAISMKGETAEIDMSKCIRCGICHDICPQEAIRHDSEKVSEEIKSNVKITRRNMELCAKHLGDEGERAKCLQRTRKYFRKQILVAQKTLEELEKLKGGGK